MREDIREAIALASAQPKVPQFSEYVFRLVQAGATVVPDDLWEELGAVFADTERDGSVPKGFWIEDNHQRSGDHNEWIDETVSEYLEDLEVSGKRKLWVIPTDELVCAHLEDEMVRDFVSLTHVYFVGTEKALRKAVPALVRSLKGG
jgi:hypothetical protein